MECSCDLLPGLPDEMALECLARVPYDAFSTAGSVSSLWKRELDSSTFHHFRKASRLTQAVVALAQAEINPAASVPPAGAKHHHLPSPPAYRLVLFEPASGTWSTLPSIPSHRHGLPLFCQLVAVGRELVVVGGWDPCTWVASDEVHVYDFTSGTWRRGAPIPGPRRSFYACAAWEERRTVFVAGGHDEYKNALSSALAYDLTLDAWSPLPDMARPRDECRGVFLSLDGGGGGSFRVIGGYVTEAQGQFEGSAEEFDVAAWRWGAVEQGQLEEGTCPRTCTAGSNGRRLYMCRPGGSVVAMDAGSSEWRRVAELPADLRMALHQVVTWEGKLVVLGSGVKMGAPQIGYILEEEEEEEEEEVGGEGKQRKKKRREWKNVEMPAEYSGHIQSACCLEI